MEDEAQAEHAAPQIQARIRTSFEHQGLMRDLGARLGHVAGCPRSERVWCSVLTRPARQPACRVCRGYYTRGDQGTERGSPAWVTTSRDWGVPAKGSLTGTPYPLPGGSSVMVMESWNEIRTFLAPRRAMITFEQACVATFGEMCRVPSLRPQLHRSQPTGWTAFKVD